MFGDSPNSLRKRVSLRKRERLGDHQNIYLKGPIRRMVAGCWSILKERYLDSEKHAQNFADQVQVSGLVEA